MTLQLTRQAPADWPALAPLIHSCNRRSDGGVHCLHAAAGADAAAQAAELAALPEAEAAFWLITTGNAQAAGVVGCEFDAALGRAWLRGPLVADVQVLDVLLPLVTPTLDAALPGINQFDAFPAADATALNAWYAAAGYERLLLHRVLRASVDAVMTTSTAPPRVRRATPADLAATWSLHQSLFPQSYLSAADFARVFHADDRALFVADAPGAAAGVAGYLYAQDNAAEKEAYVDYLGIAAPLRGCGLGRELLGAAAAWGLHSGRGSISLTVREDSHSALDLYARAGFSEFSAGRHWRRTRRGA